MLLPYELYVKIFGNLSLYELFNCERVCRYFSHVIKTHPWHNYTIRLTTCNHTRIWWFVSHYNFQKFKIDEENIKLNDDIWGVLSKKQQIIAKAEHITKCFDNYSFEFIRDRMLDFYIIFNSNIRIPVPNDTRMFNHLVKLCGEPNKTLHQVLRCILEELQLDINTKKYIRLDTIVKIPLHTKMLLEENQIAEYLIGNINDIESLNYYLEKFAKGISPRDGAGQFLIDLLRILEKIDQPYVLEEMQKNILNHSWITECVHNLSKCVNDPFLIEPCCKNISTSFGTDPKLDQLFYDIVTTFHNMKGNTHYKFLFVLNVFAAYIKSITKWKNVNTFCQYHPNYLTELLNYNKETKFCLDNEFIRKVIQKQKYQKILQCVRNNTLLRAQLHKVESQLDIDKQSKIRLPDRNLRNSFIKKIIQQQCQIRDTFGWLLQKYYLNDFSKFYHKTTPSINLTELLQKNNTDLAYFIIDNSIRYFLDSVSSPIETLIERGQVNILDFFFKLKHKLLPEKVGFAINSEMNKIIWMVKNVIKFTIEDNPQLNYITYYWKFNRCHLSLDNLQYSGNHIILLLKWVHVRNFELPDYCLANFFYQGIKYRNLHLLQVLHEYFFSRGTTKPVLDENMILIALAFMFDKKYDYNTINNWLFRKGYINTSVKKHAYITDSYLRILRGMSALSYSK